MLSGRPKVVSEMDRRRAQGFEWICRSACLPHAQAERVTAVHWSVEDLSDSVQQKETAARADSKTASRRGCSRSVDESDSGLERSVRR